MYSPEVYISQIRSRARDINILQQDIEIGVKTHCLQVNFEAVHNIDEWGSDFVPSMREALRCWNMTVISSVQEYLK